MANGVADTARQGLRRGRHVRRVPGRSLGASPADFDAIVEAGCRDGDRLVRERTRRLACRGAAVMLAVVLTAGGGGVFLSWRASEARHARAVMSECSSALSNLSSLEIRARHARRLMSDAVSGLDGSVDLDALLELSERRVPAVPSLSCSPDPQATTRRARAVSKALRAWVRPVEKALRGND